MQNIFKKLNTLHTPEWFKLINPEGLVDKTIACFKFLASSLTLFRAEPFRYNRSVQRKGYSVVSWDEHNVLNTKDMLVAGKVDNDSFPYRVSGIPEFEILGCGYTDKIAIKNIDYIYYEGCCWFREDPSTFCYVFREADTTKYYTVGFCSNYVKLQKSYTPLSDIESTPINVQVYDNLVSDGFYGISNALFLKEQGIISTGGLQGNVTVSWTEKGCTFNIMDTGTFVTYTKGKI